MVRNDKSPCTNFTFSSGAYYKVVLNLPRIFKEGEIVTFNGTSVKCNHSERRVDEAKNHVEDLLILEMVGDDLRMKATVHLYHTKQKIMVQGTRFLKFTDKFLQPFLESKIYDNKEEIEKANKIFKFATKKTQLDLSKEPEMKKRKIISRPSLSMQCEECP